MWKAIAVFLAFIPVTALAAGLVPCGGAGEPVCQPCHVMQLIEIVLDWLVEVLGVIFTLAIVVCGIYLVTSTGNPSVMQTVKKMILQMIIGYTILLSAWVIMDFIFKALLNDATNSVWAEIQCVAQPEAQAVGRITASGDNNISFTPADASSRITAIARSGSVQADITAAAAAAGINDQWHVKVLRGLVSQESSNCTNVVGPATAYGTAYGCGQLLVSTARDLDSSLRSLSDAQVAEKLQNDDAYNLTLSAKYFKQLLSRYGNDEKLALAAYNGGGAANQASQDCPGLRRWQCEWNGPGCYGTSRTDCPRNEGPNSYAQTRHYVSNILLIADGL